MEQIAIVGARMRVPGADSLETFWKNIIDARTSIEPISAEELRAAGVEPSLASSPSYVAKAGWIEGIEDFDYEFFGYAFREARAIDPQQRLLLTLCHQLLEEVGADTSNIGVLASTGFPSYMLRNLAPSEEIRAHMADMVLGNAGDCTATRIAYKLNLSGPAMTVQSGCSSSLVALHMARLSILTGQCDMALVGAASLRIPQKEGYPFQRDGVVAEDGVCRPFDANATGTVFTSGAVVIALKKLSKALEDGDEILSVLCGSAVNNDGSRKAGFTAPSVKGQMEAIQRAYARAKIDPRTLGYLEAHGTGTSLGDPIELQALTDAFSAFTQERGFCALGSVKANVGHLDVASGLVGVVKASLCLKHRVKPPLTNFVRPNPKFDLSGSPFYIPTGLSEWVAGQGSPRRAAVSSLGVGGTNGHIILEEAPAARVSPLQEDNSLVLLSAKTEAGLQAVEQATLRNVAAHPRSIGDASYTSQLFRRAYPTRGALYLASEGGGVRSAPVRASGDWRHQRLAFLFPGQSTQYAGMGRELYARWDEFRVLYDRCAELFVAQGVLDPRRMLRDTDLDASDTMLLQPYLFTLEYTLGRFLMGLGLVPELLMGHSLGEYVAAALAGVFSLEDAVKVVAQRAIIMSRAPRGAMLAVFCREEQLSQYLSEKLSLAVVNGAKNCIVGGSEADIANLRETLSKDGINSVSLKTSHAFHSHLMESAAEELRAAFEGIQLQLPDRKIISNLDGSWGQPERFTSPDYWARHLRQPVRFHDGLRTLMAVADTTVMVEVGPGHSIKNNLRSSFQEQPVGLFQTLASGKEVELVNMLLGQCWVNGMEVDWRQLYRGRRGRIVALAPHPLTPKRCWIEAQPGGMLAPRGELERAVNTKQADVGRWLFEQRWVPRGDEFQEPPVSDGKVLVLTGPQALSSALIERLRASGATPAALDLGDLLKGQSLTSIDEIAAIIQKRVGERHGAQKVIALLPLLLRGSADACEEIIRANMVMLGACKALRPGKGERLELILLSAQGVGTTEEEVHWWQSWVDGFSTVAQQEISGLTVRVLDLSDDSIREPGGERLDLLVTECLAGTDKFVALRGRTAWTREIRRVIPRPVGRKPPAAPRNVLVIGGAGNVGLVYATFFARQPGANIALVSRSAKAIGARLSQEELPAGHIWVRRRRLLEAVRAGGGQVLFLDADTSDSEALRRVTSEAKAHFGGLDAIVHAAGAASEIHYRPMFEANPKFLEDLIGPKLRVALNINRVAREHQVPQVLVVSSISAVLGGLGLHGYTLSHSILDAFARSVSDRTCRWSTVDWDAWEFYKEERQGDARDVGIDALAITESEGLTALERLAEAGWPARVVVSSGELDARYQSWVLRTTEPRAMLPPTALADRPQLKEDFIAPRDPVESKLAELWAASIGLKSVGVRDNFFELGGHSLSAISLIEEINRELGCDLQVIDIFKYPSIEKLAARVGSVRMQADALGTALQEPVPALREAQGRSNQRQNYFRMMRSRQEQGRNNE